jgi:tRNA threonylcarbamoyladenosine biosynthesis protein TsaB
LRIVAEDARQQAIRKGVLTGHQTCTVKVAMDARMGQVYDDAAVWDGRQWRVLRPPAVRSPEEVASDWCVGLSEGTAGEQQQSGALTLYAGSGLPLMPTEEADRLRAACGMWVPAEQDRSAALALCLLAAWAQGPHLDAAQVMPLYVRDRVALTTAERESDRQAQPRFEVLASSASGPASC